MIIWLLRLGIFLALIWFFNHKFALSFFFFWFYFLFLSYWVFFFSFWIPRTPNPLAFIALHIARTWIRPRRTYWNIRLALVNSSAILWNPHLSRALMNGKNDVSHLCPYRHKGYVISYLLAIMSHSSSSVKLLC